MLRPEHAGVANGDDDAIALAAGLKRVQRFLTTLRGDGQRAEMLLQPRFVCADDDEACIGRFDNVRYDFQQQVNAFLVDQAADRTDQRAFGSQGFR